MFTDVCNTVDANFASASVAAAILNKVAESKTALGRFVQSYNRGLKTCPARRIGPGVVQRR